MRVIFMGTPDFAVPSLCALADTFEVALVITRPDAVRGRGKRLEPSPVKAEAASRDIEVIEANRMTPEVLDAMRAVRADIICVAAYGCILPDAVLEMAPLGCVNVHASLLPRWRGAAPVQRAILAGDERAGVSIMRVVSALDAGAYCAQASCEVGDMTSAELMAKIGELGANALIESLREIEAGTVTWTEQDESLVTYAHKIEKAEMKLDPADDALENARRVQASSDAAPARCAAAGKGVRIMRATICEDMRPSVGAVEVSRGRVALGCADGAFEVISVKPDGKHEMEASAWAAGLRGDDIAWERV